MVAQMSSSLEGKSVSTDEIERAIFSYTNEERKNRGVVALNWDESLAVVAREHSQDMVENCFFAHDNLRGEDPTARAKRYGYPVRKMLGSGWYSVGIAENMVVLQEVSGEGTLQGGEDSVSRFLVDQARQTTNDPGGVIWVVMMTRSTQNFCSLIIGDDF